MPGLTPASTQILPAACTRSRDAPAASRSRPMPDNVIRAAAADRVGDDAARAAEFGADARAFQIHFRDVELD